MPDLIIAALAVVGAFAIAVTGFAVNHRSGDKQTRKRIADFEARQAERDWFMRRFAAVVAMEPELTQIGRRIVAEDLYALPEEEA